MRRRSGSGVERVLSLLEWLAENPGQHGVREIARATSMQKSTAHRMLAALGKHHWVRQAAEDGKYSIGLKVLQLASAVLGRNTLLDVAAPICRELAQSAGEAVYVGVREGDHVVIIHKVGGLRGIRFEEDVGTRAYLHTTAIGKAILAGLTDDEIISALKPAGLPRRTSSSIHQWKALARQIAGIRRSGFAESDEENYIGALGIAAAVRDHTGQVVAAITVAGLKSRMLGERHAIVGLVRQAAARISLELGFHERQSGSLATPSSSRRVNRSSVESRRRNGMSHAGHTGLSLGRGKRAE